jgi:hypothetical protein
MTAPNATDHLAAICKWQQIAKESPSDNMTYHAPTIRAMLRDFVLPNAEVHRARSAPVQPLVGRIRELLDEENRVHNGAIPPWHSHPAQGIISTMADHMDPRAVDIVCDEGLDGKTCELIVSAVNALPALLAIAEAAAAVVAIDADPNGSVDANGGAIDQLSFALSLLPEEIK